MTSRKLYAGNYVRRIGQEGITATVGSVNDDGTVTLIGNWQPQNNGGVFWWWPDAQTFKDDPSKWEIAPPPEEVIEAQRERICELEEQLAWLEHEQKRSV